MKHNFTKQVSLFSALFIFSLSAIAGESQIHCPSLNLIKQTSKNLKYVDVGDAPFYTVSTDYYFEAFSDGDISWMVVTLLRDTTSIEDAVSKARQSVAEVQSAASEYADAVFDSMYGCSYLSTNYSNVIALGVDFKKFPKPSAERVRSAENAESLIRTGARLN